MDWTDRAIKILGDNPRADLVSDMVQIAEEAERFGKNQMLDKVLGITHNSADYEEAMVAIDALASHQGEPVTPPGVESGSGLYPCRECGKPRTKEQGGTTFTVCDVCWDRLHPVRESNRGGE